MNTVSMQLPFAPMEWWKVVFGWDQNTHLGNAKFCWDFIRAVGTSGGAPLFAVAAGTVVQIEANGNWIYVEHAPGENFAYVHIQNNSWSVNVGDKVQMGQMIAAVGDTGTSPGNYHLHAALSNIFDGNNASFTTVESQFMDYDVSTDGGKSWIHVKQGVPKTGEWVRRTSQWSAWQNREDGFIIGGPTAISRKPTITDIFGRGLDNRLWQNTYVSGQGWGGWFRHEDGFILGSSPEIDSMNPDHLHIFACDPSGKVFQKWWPGVGGWSNWSPWRAREAGVIIGSPTATSRKSTITDMFARGLDNRLWQNSYVSGQGWGGWFSHEDGFILGSSPTIDSRHPDELHIFACDPSGKVFQKWWKSND